LEPGRAFFLSSDFLLFIRSSGLFASVDQSKASRCEYPSLDLAMAGSRSRVDFSDLLWQYVQNKSEPVSCARQRKMTVYDPHPSREKIAIDPAIERILQVLGLRLTSRDSGQLNLFLGKL